MLSFVTASRSNSDFIGSAYQKRNVREKMTSTSFENIFATKGEGEKSISKTTLTSYDSISNSKKYYFDAVRNSKETQYNVTNLSGYTKYEKMLEEYNALTESQESETSTNIIVKPDGSRVLVVTMNIGGMETTMSMEISKPTEFPNEQAVDDTETKQLGQGIADEAEVMVNQ
ncbi:hypothetical protein [Geosporobacter ferrireducens]|uniref:Uncharacterized protein n=1 Tax=Geosporobacter ferrireducens TaxID=1424294 RepID=A0A1D8GN49_9FIRM|nr:hypothetical protein [Geosporobacter ferrireducens]AOT72297.1 hypothetical protein Gferi_23765 [Geosporobacter ferrireducens]